MAYHVYPDPQTSPQSINTGAQYTFSNFQQVAAVGGTMYITLAMFAPSGTPGAPTLQVQAGTGALQTVNTASTSPLYSMPGTDTTYLVGVLGLLSQSGWVYSFTISSLEADSTWNLIVTNTDTTAPSRLFVLVVADNAPDSLQPWMDIDASLAFDALTTESPQLAATIRNYGTGSLAISTLTPGGANGNQFTPDPLPPSFLPGTETNQPITLSAQAAIIKLSATLTADGDSLALTTAGHNKVLSLSAIVGQLELAFLVDASGSMAADPSGVQVDLTVDPAATRWSLARSGLAAALTLLKNHAVGKGNFAVNMYPDISSLPGNPNTAYTGGPVTSPSAEEIEGTPTSMVPITGTPMGGPNGTIDDAIANINNLFTRYNKAATPMGAGIQRAINQGDPTDCGYFDSTTLGKQVNRRWLILMSDGNWNSGPPPSDSYLQFPSTAKALRTAAIAYGKETGPGTQPPDVYPNRTLLNQIITAGAPGGTPTGVEFHDADLDNTTNGIKGYMNSLVGLGLSTIADPIGVLTTAAPVVKRLIPVTALDNRITFAVMWSTLNSQRLRVQVQTPLGELLEAPAAGVSVDENDRFRMITVSPDFVHNARDPANPRIGTWTLIITLLPIKDKPVAEDSEQYDYQVLLDSRLKLGVTLDPGSHSAGDPITTTAWLTVDGAGLPNASVTLACASPGSSLYNFLAKSPLTLAEYQAAAQQQAGNPDIDSIGIKGAGLATKGITYSPSRGTSTIPMVDASGRGTYTATTTSTSVPGSYRLTVTAVGALPDGTPFRREQSLDVYVTVRPDVAFSPIDFVYGTTVVDRTTFSTATITVRPGDRFGNVILIDPSIDPTVVFTTSLGTFSGPIVDNHDGSYTRTVVYPVGSTPTVGVTVGGVALGPPLPLAPLSSLKFVDAVYGFALGSQAAAGANKHTDPRACLGDPTARPTSTFVSLGGGGSLVVGIRHHYELPSRTGQDIVVFVQPDQQPRPYAVEVMRGDDFHHGNWERLGTSVGVTQSFSLHAAHLPAASAIRIVDLNHRVTNLDGTPSATPGVSILAVGARHVEEGDGDFDDLIIDWLKRIGHAIFSWP